MGTHNLTELRRNFYLFIFFFESVIENSSIYKTENREVEKVVGVGGISGEVKV